MTVYYIKVSGASETREAVDAFRRSGYSTLYEDYYWRTCVGYVAAIKGRMSSVQLCDSIINRDEFVFRPFSSMRLGLE